MINTEVVDAANYAECHPPMCGKVNSKHGTQQPKIVSVAL